VCLKICLLCLQLGVNYIPVIYTHSFVLATQAWTLEEVKVLPNIKSAKKRVKLSTLKRSVNIAQRSALKTALKKTLSSIAAGDAAVAKADLSLAVKKLDTAAAKGLIHKNQAARRKSRLMKKLNAIAK
jgi:small subunit ribosomal protein S20